MLNLAIRSSFEVIIGLRTDNSGYLSAFNTFASDWVRALPMVCHFLLSFCPSYEKFSSAS